MASMAWLVADTVADDDDKASTRYGSWATMFCTDKRPPSPTLQILSFETAKNMSRLAALYKSLTDEEFFKLRIGPMRSPGVSFLNSTDENYLLGLACKEKLEDLDSIASVVSRLCKKRIDDELNAFEFAYENMKQGIIDVKNLDFSSRNVAKVVEKMEKYANNTTSLLASLMALKDLEISDENLQAWKKFDYLKNNLHYLNEKLSYQKKQVKHFRQVSLWNKTFDKTIRLMARVVCVVYARICVVFGTFVPGLLSIAAATASANKCSFGGLYVSRLRANFNMKVHPEANSLFVKEEKHVKKAFKSGPNKVANNVSGGTIRRNKRLMQLAPANTAGAAGLAVHYANVIVTAETYFYSTGTISDEARKNLYEMLPMKLKQTLRGKLRSHWYKDEWKGKDLSHGWKEALEHIIEWLAPVAHDTLRWQQERNLLVKQNIDARPSSVLLFQTLYFSDLEKTEAAIVEVLVGLSCIYRYENRRERNGGVGYNIPYVCTSS